MFHVKKAPEVQKPKVQWRVGETPHESHPDAWSVFLPHQCDNWQIAGEYEDVGLPHDEAVALLEEFVNRAQAALQMLRDRREGEV